MHNIIRVDAFLEQGRDNLKNWNQGKRYEIKSQMFCRYIIIVCLKLLKVGSYSPSLAESKKECNNYSYPSILGWRMIINEIKVART